jgi:hypothetical protein
LLIALVEICTQRLELVSKTFTWSHPLTVPDKALTEHRLLFTIVDTPFKPEKKRLAVCA